MARCSWSMNEARHQKQCRGHTTHATSSSATTQRSLRASVSTRACDDGSYFITDQNNLILDADFGPITDPKKLALLLNERAGIVEHGLFLEIASDVIVAETEGIRHLKRK